MQSTHVFRLSSAPRIWAVLARFAVILPALTVGHRSLAASSHPIVRAEQILWHPVEDQNHRTVGSVSDLLVEMPSGRVLFAAITPSELFEFARAVPPTALTRESNGTLRLNLSDDAWEQAPRLSPNGRKIEQFTRNGVQLRGHYEPAWAPPQPQPSRGLEVIATTPGRPPVPRYVSLEELMNTPVKDLNSQELGAVGGFLVDWDDHRVMYALITRNGDALFASIANAWAVPMTALAPPLGGSAAVVNAPPDAFRRAPVLTGDAWRNRPAQVYRFRSQNLTASMQRQQR